MKLIIYIFAFLVLFSFVTASGFGVSPSKLDFGIVDYNKQYVRQINIQNPNDHKLELNLLPNSNEIKTKDTLVLSKKSKEKLDVNLLVQDCYDPGKYEKLLMIKTDKTIGSGIGIKILFEINQTDCENNKITGFAVVDKGYLGNYGTYIVAGFLGLIVLIVVIKVFTRKYISK